MHLRFFITYLYLKRLNNESHSSGMQPHVRIIENALCCHRMRYTYIYVSIKTRTHTMYDTDLFW